MTEQLAQSIGSAGIDIAYETFGDSAHPSVLLIMGIASQMIHWPLGLIEELCARDLYVIRFDNRDSGLSTHFHDAPVPNLPAALQGDLSSASYTLSDMASDCIALLDHLQIQQAHIVGASMGGFIAQTVAIEYPERVLSLTSMMSSTGAMLVGQADPEVWTSIGAMAPTNREEVIEQALLAFDIVGSPGYERDEAAIRDRAGLAYDRCYDPVGVMRQSVAVIASGDRTAALAKLSLPTLVIHGEADRMCNISGGQATADAVPGACFHRIPGMGHDMPRALWPEFAAQIAGLVHKLSA